MVLFIIFQTNERTHIIRSLNCIIGQYDLLYSIKNEIIGDIFVLAQVDYTLFRAHYEEKGKG